MKIIKRRKFIKNILYSFLVLVGFFNFKRITKENSYLENFLKKINLPNPKNKNLIKALYNFNYENYIKFISDYKNSKFKSPDEFSSWLYKKIAEDYKKNKIIIVENTFVSETEISLLIIKYI